MSYARVHNYKFELLGRTVLMQGLAEIPSLSRLLDMIVMETAVRHFVSPFVLLLRK